VSRSCIPQHTLISLKPLTWRVSVATLPEPRTPVPKVGVMLQAAATKSVTRMMAMMLSLALFMASLLIRDDLEQLGLNIDLQSDLRIPLTKVSRMKT
jgi:hypothetical protein